MVLPMCGVGIPSLNRLPCSLVPSNSKAVAREFLFTRRILWEADRFEGSPTLRVVDRSEVMRLRWTVRTGGSTISLLQAVSDLMLICSAPNGQITCSVMCGHFCSQREMSPLGSLFVCSSLCFVR